jgi:hypothetical protein
VTLPLGPSSVHCSKVCKIVEVKSLIACEKKGVRGEEGSPGFGKIIGGGGGELSMPLYKGLPDINFREKVQLKSLVEIPVFFL